MTVGYRRCHDRPGRRVGRFRGQEVIPVSKSAPPLAKGIIYALVAAALFGTSTPLAKLLLGELPPIALAGLLYLGSGVRLSA